MTDSNTPIVLVICNDYGELAFALYLLARQPFAQNTTLMLPPRLHAQNSEVLPGRTLVYHSLDDVRHELDSSTPGVLGLFSGYLLPVHRLCSTDELGSLLSSTQAQGWKCFTSDPFLGLLADVDPGELIKFKPPAHSKRWSRFSVISRKRHAVEAQEDKDQLVPALIRQILEGMLHVYPCGESPKESDQDFGKRLNFHNPAIFLRPQHVPSAITPTSVLGRQRWMFVLGDDDYAVQEEKHGKAMLGISRGFRRILLQKLHETLAAGRVPTLIAPARVIRAVIKHSPAADTMELLPHCEYSRFEYLLRDAEYMFCWNPVSFSCVLRTLTDKPWFTFDDGHLLRSMNAAYAQRVSEWFYRGDEPPRLDIDSTLTREAMEEATQRYLISTWRVRQGLLASPDPQSLFAALEPGRAIEELKSLKQAFDTVQQLGELVSSNELDGSFVVDTALLPYPKSAISGALTLLLERGAGDQAEFARLAAPTLAFFQPGVGADRQTLDSPGPDGKPWKESVEQDMVAITRDLLASPDPQPLSSAQAPGRAIQEANELVAAFDIVQRLGEIVAANNMDGSFVVDTALLAYPKNGFKRAVRLLLERGAGDQAEFARLAAPTLAFFQPDVGAGSRPLDSRRIDGRPWREAVEADMVAITRDLRN